MKVFSDTNVYAAAALLGEAAEELVAATERAGWRIFVSLYLLDELERVLTEPPRLLPAAGRLVPPADGAAAPTAEGGWTEAAERALGWPARRRPV